MMIPLFKVSCDTPNIMPALKQVFESGYIGQGPKVEEFEKQLRERFQSDYILTTNSGTSAEHLGIRLLNLEPGDEVLTTPLSCTATNWPLLAHKLHLRWLDIDPDTLNICLDDLTRKLTEKTKLVVFVHWGGYPIDFYKLENIMDAHRRLYGNAPWIIEDCAHSFGTTYKGKPIAGQYDGHIRFFSFQAIKHLTCGDGGCLVVPNQLMYHKGKLTRWYGIDREHNTKDFRCEADIDEWGYKFHMNDINATIGLENLKKVDWVLERHRENARYYNSALFDVNGMNLLQQGGLGQSSYWLYTIWVEEKEKFTKWMKECGIMVSRVHERNDEHSCVKQFRCQLPNLTWICNHMICIPVGWWVTNENREYIVDCIRKGW